MDEDRVKTSSAPSLYGKNSEIGAKNKGVQALNYNFYSPALLHCC